MTGAPSFERFDYILRTNKHIERKLVFDVLHAASRIFGLRDHWYVGFGSMWFGDFRLAHKALGIREMLSLEHQEHAERADFNRPFSCVSVIPGESSQALPHVAEEKWRAPAIAWLDYDKELNGDVIADLDLLITKSAPNSVLIVTLNGVRGTYRIRKPNGQNTRSETSVGVVESFLGESSTPARFIPSVNAAGVAQDVQESRFPEFFAEALLTHLQHRLVHSAREVAGERMQFVPLYSISHKDGADMVTVGGAICKESDADKWRTCVSDHPILSDQNGMVSYCRLDLIPVTLKEKITLDSCLPLPEEEDAFLVSAKGAGIKLADDELRKYRKFYRHFPVFVESSL